MTANADYEAVVAAGNALAQAMEAAGNHERYWPRDMRLDGSDYAVDNALDAWYLTTGQPSPIDGSET